MGHPPAASQVPPPRGTDAERVPVRGCVLPIAAAPRPWIPKGLLQPEIPPEPVEGLVSPDRARAPGSERGGRERERGAKRR